MPQQLDLLGQPVSTAELLREPRRRVAGRPWDGGYAAHPGSAGTDETCRTCAFKVRTGRPGKHFYKCRLMRHAWTHGPGSDIKLRTPACSRWLADKAEDVAL